MTAFVFGRGWAARPSRKAVLSAALLFSVIASPNAQAQSFLTIWQTTRANEPTLQASRFNLVAAEERTTQAAAALLPQLSATYSKNQNLRNYQQVQEPSTVTQEHFGTTTSAVNLTQPLWRSASRHAWTQAEDGQRQARHQLAGTEQELATRFITTWFDLMAARDTVHFAGEQIKASQLQLNIHQRGLVLGISNEVQRDDAASKHEQALAELVGAESDYQSKFAAVEQLAGSLPHLTPPTFISALDQPLFKSLAPVDLWLSRAGNQSPGILAAEEGLAAALNEIRKQQAQHELTVDLVGSVSRNDQAEAGNTPGQSGYRMQQSSFGLQVSIPLYSGGAQTAKVREAIALANKAEFDLDAARRTAALQVKQAWATARVSLGKVAAGRQAVTAANTAVRAALSGQTTGLKTILEELQAKQQLAVARRDLLRTLYDNIISFAKLRAATGEITDSFFENVQFALLDGSTLDADAISKIEMAPVKTSFFCDADESKRLLPFAISSDCVKSDMSVFSFRIGLGINDNPSE